MDMHQRRYTRRQAVLAGLGALGGLGLAGGPGVGRALAGAGVGSGRGVRGRVSAHLVSASRDFGFRLLDGLAALQPDQNVLISPSSIATALAMAYNGAAGATQAAMAATLGLQGMGTREVNEGYAALAATLHGLDPHVDLTIANSLWSRAGIPFNPAFVAALKQYYGAEAATLDFASRGASATVNGWVKAQTRGKIPRIVPDQIDPATILYLINAIYFKGRWAVPFDKKQTHERPFAAPGGPKGVPMMAHTDTLPYYRGDLFQAVSLPYGNGAWSMVVLLPDPGSDLGSLRARLTASAWDAWMARLAPMHGTILLPRFKVDYAHNLNEVLIALGMGEAFGGGADFSRIIAGRRVAISTVDHAALMEVDEEGTTAAAATSVGIGTVAVISGFTMVVDRPFLCAIRDRTTGTVLFAGAVVDPTAK